jgi:SAM-dependent methyltransferase
MGKKVSSRELGLILGARLLKTEDLHYGYWTEELPLRLANLPQAQARYTDFLLGHIPPGVGSVLDVGCGTGHVAQQLVARGYRVECLSPSPELTRLARERLGDSAPVHLTTLEGFASAARFDLVLFSESFQYIPMAAALGKAHDLLAPGGHVLIADFFRRPAAGESPLKGGHDLEAFQALLGRLPFTVLSDEDITARTAPNLDLVDGLLRDYALPVWETAAYYLRQNYPRLSRLGARLFRSRLERLRFKYFSGRRTAANFARYKSYRCVLLRRAE